MVYSISDIQAKSYSPCHLVNRNLAQGISLSTLTLPWGLDDSKGLGTKAMNWEATMLLSAPLQGLLKTEGQ